jgi:hypothetical protein
MRNFETDYLISWDFNGKDCPCITIYVMYQDGKNGTKVVGEQIGTSYKQSGVVSLRQLLAEYEEKRNRNFKDERYERLKEFLKTKGEKGEENGNS